MTEPCDKGPAIEQLKNDNERTHEKLDKLIDLFTAVAVQKGRVDALEGKFEDHETRIRKLEPLKILYTLGKWIAGIGGVLVGAWAIYLLGLGG